MNGLSHIERMTPCVVSTEVMLVAPACCALAMELLSASQYGGGSLTELIPTASAAIISCRTLAGWFCGAIISLLMPTRISRSAATPEKNDAGVLLGISWSMWPGQVQLPAAPFEASCRNIVPPIVAQPLLETRPG